MHSGDWKDTPVILTNKNRLDVGFKNQVNWYLETGMRAITVIDNGSTYPPLLDFYKTVEKDITLFRPEVDLGWRGGWAFWDLGLNKAYTTPVLISDSDCVPDEQCPKDLVPILLEILDEFPNCRKVSPGVRIDDIPDHFSRKKEVIDGESCQWVDKVPRSKAPEIYNAHTDTTTTLCADGGVIQWNDQQFRTGFPYVIKHTPWYLNGSTDEEKYYAAHLGTGWSYWQGK